MKQMKKILSIVLILSALVMLLSACGSKGEIVAVYNNTPVYEEDVQDIINYYILTNATLDTTDEEKSEMAKEAVRTYVRYKVLEIDLKKKGYTVDEKALNQTVKEMIEYLDKNFTGGYKDWRNMYGLSKNFLKEDMRRYELASLFNEYASTTIEVTDEEIETYYHANGGAYADPAGYTWTGVLREVFDLKDEEECAAAEAEMENYIRQINAGDMTLEQVKADLLEKYTEEDGYTKTNLFSGENFTAISDFAIIPNLSDALEAIKKEYGELDPDADPKEDAEAYEKYMNYLGDCFRAEVYYALQNMEIGDVYSKPLKSYAGYFIIRLDKIKTTNGFKPLDEVRDEIKTELLNEKITGMFETRLTELESEYNVQYLFDVSVS
jgi:lipoprotein